MFECPVRPSTKPTAPKFTTFSGGQDGTYDPIMTGACGVYWTDKASYEANLQARQTQLDAAIAVSRPTVHEANRAEIQGAFVPQIECQPCS